MPLQIGNEKSSVGEFFDVTGSFTDQTVILENSNQQMDYIGYALATDVELTIKGDVGHFAGAELAGGKLIIDGNTLDYSGCSMSKGSIEITGNGNDAGLVRHRNFHQLFFRYLVIFLNRIWPQCLAGRHTE